jgi:phosphohistidine phosphatase
VDLYLVRHALAELRDHERWPDDADRPLSANGIKRFCREARGLRRIGVGVDAVLSSSFVRAWSTAEILAEEAGWPVAERCPPLEPPAPASACVGVLRARNESSLALVGHQPQLSELASLLLAGSEDTVRLQLGKGGIICVRFTERPAPGDGILRWSASPRILRRLGR